MLFKKFANIDVFDIELNCGSSDDFIRCVKSLEPTFGAINLEDIKAPECFYIEERLKAEMSIPVFHDDQHGTAIIAGAAFLNALELTQKKVEQVRVVFSGGGAAAVACAHLFISLGVKKQNLMMVDSKGVLYKGRSEGMNPYKEQFCLETKKRTLEEAISGADAFVGVSGPDLLKPEYLRSMADNPIIFALANPDPEINPDLARRTRADAIVATGRSDHPNQVNNVLGFPFIFRGALDVGARCVNEEMKMAAVHAIAKLAKEDVPDVVQQMYKDLPGYAFGRDYLIPKPVDPRVLLRVAPAVAKAAMDSGVARHKVNLKEYQERMESLLGATRQVVAKTRRQLRSKIKNDKVKKPLLVIPHGHHATVIRAVSQVFSENLIDLFLLGSKEQICSYALELGYKDFERMARFEDPLSSRWSGEFAEALFSLRARRGVSKTGADQLVRNSNTFAALMVKQGLADGLISGIVEPYADAVRPILQVLGANKEKTPCGVYMLSVEEKLYFLADCTLNIEPSLEQLVGIGKAAVEVAKGFTDEPLRLAMLSFSSFGSAPHPKSVLMRKAASLLESEVPDVKVEGEIQADVALSDHLQRRNFPFCKLEGRANILIFPDLSSANIGQKLITSFSKEATATGPILYGINHPATVMQLGATVDELVKMIYITANQIMRQK